MRPGADMLTLIAWIEAEPARAEGVREGIEMAARWHEEKHRRWIADGDHRLAIFHYNAMLSIRALSPPPAEPTGMTAEPSAPVAPDWPTRCAALEADGIAARRRVAELLAENAKLRAIVKELDDALGEDDGEYPDDKPMTLKCGRWTYYSLSLGLLRRARSLLQGGPDAG